MRHILSRQRWLMAALAATALLAAPMWASAHPTHYMANLTSLNNSGVTGMANLTLNNDMLTVHITATGLVADMPHPQHIHGTFDSSGNPTNATTPTLAVDSNNDGVIELGEGASTYGPILVPLTPFTTAPGGMINFTGTYDLSDSSIYANGYNKQSLFPLDFREIVLHGAYTPVDINDNLLGLSFKAGDYDPVFPVASGVIVASNAVPEPAALGMMLAGLGLLIGFLGLRRKHS